MEGSFKQFGPVANNYKPVAQFLQLFIQIKVYKTKRIKNYESRIAAEISTLDLNLKTEK